MLRKLNRWALAVVLVTGLGAVACSSAEDEAAAQAAARQTELEALEQQKQALDAQRQELDAARQTAQQAEGDAKAAAEAEVQRLEGEVTAQSDDLMGKLVVFINADAPTPGEPLDDVQTAAVRMLSEEYILLGQEYIEKGGDFGRALDIYDQALAVDPENQDLLAAKARAEEERYMTAERFAAVKKGMTQDQVRQTLGTPFHRNVREYDQGRVLWLYRKDPAGAAAAVWFRPVDGELEVYETNFEQVKAGEEAP